MNWMKPFQEFNLKPIQHEIDKHAQDIFLDWKATLDESMRNRIPIPDENRLKAMIAHGFIQALAALSRKKCQSKPKGWAEGFVVGFVQGKVDILWKGMFALCHDPEFMRETWKQAILEVLSINQEFRLMVNRLVESYIKNYCLPKVGDSQDDEAIIEMMRNADAECDTNWNLFKEQFNQELVQDMAETVQKRLAAMEGEIDDLNRYFSPDSIRSLIRENLLGNY